MRPQTWMWGTADKPAILPKTRGSGIMVSDFIDEHHGHLCQSHEELEYGAARDGYWTSEKFMNQIERAYKISHFKYTPAMHTLVWLFDQSSSHRNMKPGGKRSVMHDTIWAGQKQSMVDAAGIPKGMKMLLEECNTKS